MPTIIHKVDGLPVEESVLDAEGNVKRKEFSELVMREYAETGSLSGKKLMEAVEQYETEIADHVIE